MWLYLVLELLAVVLMVPSAVAFLQDPDLSAPSVYLAAICVAETWYMAVFFSHNLCKLSRKCFTSKGYVQVSIWTMSYSGMAARRCAHMFSGLLCLQRCIAIAFPLKARRYRTVKGLPLVSAVLLSVTLHLYRPLRLTPVKISDDKQERWTQGFSTLFLRYRSVFESVEQVTVFLTMYVPMLVCLISNCLMLFALRRQKKMNNVDSRRTNASSRSQAERQITRVILGSTFLMLMLNTPVNINEVVATHLPHYGILRREHFLYKVLRSCFSIINHSCDILVGMSYLVLSDSFRQRFLALFTRTSTSSCCSGCGACAASSDSIPSSITADSPTPVAPAAVAASSSSGAIPGLAEQNSACANPV
ncbi:uncharacterized protein LOC143293170 [Babylonia areolata]|uniref:uncharacterized protein LOC143293170 n=1 Tax=Babylonia areolata TaxID=304850 RepID=UPI003FD1013A